MFSIVSSVPQEPEEVLLTPSEKAHLSGNTDGFSKEKQRYIKCRLKKKLKDNGISNIWLNAATPLQCCNALDNLLLPIARGNLVGRRNAVYYNGNNETMREEEEKIIGVQSGNLVS